MVEFVLNGQTIVLNSLHPDLDQAFIDLHAAYLGQAPLDWSVFHRAVATFLAATPDRHSSHDLYFNNFIAIWNSLLASRRFDDAQALWGAALAPVLQFERSNPPRQVHKGTAYYFWGMTAILGGDIDAGYALMHQAVEEDVLTSGQLSPDTPAYALASLNFAKPDQAFRHWVLAEAQYLDARQNAYSALHSRPFTLEAFRARFLNAPPSTDIAFLFAYTIARLMRLSAVPSHAMRSRFIGQLLINLFFDITLCVEAAASAKNPGPGTFIDQAEFIASSAGHPLSSDQLRHINQLFRGDFDQALQLALDGALPLPGGGIADRAQSDISVAYGIRNRGAHEVSFGPTVWRRRMEIEQALLNVLFMTVDFCY